jgi:hypothetical protein
LFSSTLLLLQLQSLSRYVSQIKQTILFIFIKLKIFINIKILINYKHFIQMAYKLQKLVSEQSLPLNQRSNLVNFMIPGDQGVSVDFANSYVQFQLRVTGSGSGSIAMGQDGQPYYPVAMVRRARLVSSTKGTLHEVNNLNILINNLMFHSKTASENNSDALYGWGAVLGSDGVHSVFSYNSDDLSNNCVVRIPVSHLVPGSLGSDELFFDKVGTITLQLELEPTKNLFLQIVDPRWGSTDPDFIGVISCNNIAADAADRTLVTATTANQFLGVYQVGDKVRVSYTVAGAQAALDCVVTAAAVTGATINVTPALPAGALTGVSIAYNNVNIHCTSYVSTNAIQTTLTVPNCAMNIIEQPLQQFNGSIPDVTSSLLPLICNIDYWTYTTADGTGLAQAATLTGQTITAAVVNPNTKVVTLTIAPGIPAVANTLTVAGIVITPVNQNLPNAVWSVEQAFLFPMIKMVGESPKKPMLYTAFEYEPLAMVSDGSNFSREVLCDANTINTFLLTPPATNTSQLLSASNGVTNYRFYLNDIALSSVPLQLSSTLQKDMLMRVYNNSLDYPLRNLNQKKNQPLFSTALVNQFVAKHKPATVMGVPNLTRSSERDKLRIEMNGAGMPTGNTVYFFKQVYKMM